MKHIDDQIREVFSKKLSNSEADVSPHLWEAVQSQMAGSGGGTVGTVAKVVSMKLIVAASVAVIAVASVLYFSISERTIAKNETTLPTGNVPAPASEPTKEKDSSSASENTLIEQQPEVQKIQEVDTKSSALHETQGESSENQNSTTPSITNSEPLHSSSVEMEEQRSDKGENQQVEIASTESADKITGIFNVVPIDIYEMRYSFQTQDAATTYDWNFGDDHHSSEKSPNHHFEEEGNYIITLEVTDAAGSKKSSSHEMSLYEPGKAIIPNIFTPNGDGSNDTFDPSLKSEGVTFTKIIVSDSQGRVVFESNGQPWDGNDPSGSPCNSGTYQYYVEGFDRNQEILKYKGVVTLFR